MKNYKLINNSLGWFAFLVAAVTYLLTIEPTTSFWDCGEFITSAFKLEVGHPPGAPFFMILGRFFTLFAFGDVTQVAMMVNIMSALASAFTILFLFWSITHIAKRIISKTGELTKAQIIVVMGSGIVGALAYTFSDTFWFSAVEGEVYATSSLFTAVVFWAILKWENEADQRYANRWLILIAYLMGLSIGVHLLNLLAIPAIVFIYYFKKYEVTVKGIIYSALVSMGILIIVMYGVIQGLFVMGSKVELLFVNSFGLSFKSGLIVFFVLVFGALAYGIYRTFRKNQVLWNTIFTMFTVILIGYSSFALILIRSIADTPMNQNKPDDVFALLSYLNREQYGDRPLMYGQYFNSSLDENDPYPETTPIRYDKQDEDGKDYYKTVSFNRTRNYKSSDKVLFPRLYSDQESPDHVRGYINWTSGDESDFYYAQLNPETEQPVTDQYGNIQYDHYNPKRLPTFGENLKYFFSYQLNHMYLRYFMWNFAGRQNDIQSHGKSSHAYKNVKDGNWISGIKFIDEIRLGNQDEITDVMKNNKARNAYYFLPLLLGILGMIFMYNKGKKGKQYFWVVMLFFFFTGIAIVLYLNQPPFQPRERDYAYAGSFYVFAMYIGFGVAFIYNFLKKYLPGVAAAGIATAISLLVPVLMAQQNWDDHDRSDRYTATDYAKNYLDSCDENAIIFTNGDNDTFPLWYVQEVEGYRTDVRVINLSYFNTDWYIDQMRKRAYDSPPVNFTLTPEQYEIGQRDIVYRMETPNLYLQEKYNAHKEEFKEEYSTLFNEFLSFLANSKFKTVFEKDYERLNKGLELTSPIQLFSITNQLEAINSERNLGLSTDQIAIFNKQFEDLLIKISTKSLPLKAAIYHISQDDKSYKAPLQNGEFVNYLPSSRFVIPVDKEKVLKNGIVEESDKNQITDKVEWDIRKSHITKNQMMVLDMLATANWERPIYFATTVGNSHYLNLEPYFQLEGLAYKIVPIKTSTRSYGNDGRVNSDILYDNLMNKFQWGGLDTNPEKIYMDENNRRFVMNLKSTFLSLTEQLVKEKKYKKAEEVLDKCFSLFNADQAPYNYYDLLLADLYYQIDKNDKGQEILKTAANLFHDEAEYYLSLEDEYLAGITDDVGRLALMYEETIKMFYAKDEIELANEYGMLIFDKIEERFGFGLTLSQLNSMEAQTNWYAGLSDFEGGFLQLYMTLSRIMNE